MIKKYLLPSLCAFVILLGFTPSASADPIVLDGTVGTTVSFGAILDNSGNDVPLFLNGSSITNNSPLTINDLLFVNFPASIAANASASGILFTIDLPADLTPGLYNFIYEIQGGFTPEDQFVLNPDQDEFQVNVQAAPVPEPGTWALVATGFGALGTLYTRRRQGTSGRAA